ncbi:MAG: glycoside hydrolase family 4 [Kiritimatiellae bacterium]|nr:glycoside hydrolase family 4 [Kiritimatiellia bacterium]
MKGPKVVVVGAGSLFFGRQALWNMIMSDALNTGTLAYVDIDRDRLALMMELGRKAIAHKKVPLKLEGSTDRREVLKGADFVVLSFARDGVRFRGVDCAISEKYGVRMCSGDTIGPGGIFRAMRELPVILDIARDVKALCPDAWVINYINPTAVNGLGLMRHADVKSFALCDGLHMPHVKKNYLAQCRVVEKAGAATPDLLAKFDLEIAGVNHFTWLLKAEFEGRDVTPALRESVAAAAAKETDEGHSKQRFNRTYALELWDIFGIYPACIGHTKEYVPYWQGWQVKSNQLPPLSIFDVNERYKRHEAMWTDVNAFNSGAKPLDEFFKGMGPDHATDIIKAMWAGDKGPFYINQANRGAVGNLPDDAFLELLSDVDMNGPVPRRVSDFPLGVRALQMQVLDTHELTVEAIVKQDKGVLRRAMLTDPIVNSIPDGDAMIEDLLEAEKEIIPAAWYGSQ